MNRLIDSVFGIGMVMLWFMTLFIYGYHFLYTVMNIQYAEHSGYAFYLVMGILFPPLGFFNGLFLLMA